MILTAKFGFPLQVRTYPVTPAPFTIRAEVILRGVQLACTQCSGAC